MNQIVVRLIPLCGEEVSDERWRRLRLAAKRFLVSDAPTRS